MKTSKQLALILTAGALAAIAAPLAQTTISTPSPPASTSPPVGADRLMVAKEAFLVALQESAKDPAVAAALKAGNATVKAAMLKYNPMLKSVFDANPALADNLVVLGDGRAGWYYGAGSIIGPGGPAGPPMPQANPLPSNSGPSSQANPGGNSAGMTSGSK